MFNDLLDLSMLRPALRVRDRREKNKGLTVELSFLIHLHENDLPLLTLIQKTLGYGNIRKSGKGLI